MAEKRKRGQNFSIEEKDRLVKLLGSHKTTILNKKTDGTTNEAKNKAWREVTEAFNATGTVFRTKESLIKIWEKIKSESKIYYQNLKKSTTQTGGGPIDIKVDPILEQACALLGRACTGIEGVQDSDFEDTILHSKLPRLDSNNAALIEEPQENITLYVEGFQPSLMVASTLEEEVACEVIPSSSQAVETTPVGAQQASNNNQNSNTNYRTPLWSRRRPQIRQSNERAVAMSSLCTSYKNVNKKKEDIEDLKKQLLKEEIEFKRKLYILQLQAAEKEVEIKTEVLKQLKDGKMDGRSMIEK